MKFEFKFKIGFIKCGYFRLTAFPHVIDAPSVCAAEMIWFAFGKGAVALDTAVGAICQLTMRTSMNERTELAFRKKNYRCRDHTESNPECIYCRICIGTCAVDKGA